MSQEEKNAVLLVIAISFYIASIYHFIDSHDYIYSLKKGMTKEYVNGDAYNYIIAASYSSTIMLKSIWFAILGSCSLLLIKPVPNQTEK